MHEHELMRKLMRTCAAARRKPMDKVGDKPHARRGFGHILDLLQEGNGVSQQQLADILGIRPQSVSEAVSTLEERCYVIKKTSEKDKRMTLVYITEQGIHKRQELAEERKAHAQKFFSVLSDGEKEQLMLILEKLSREDE